MHVNVSLFQNIEICMTCNEYIEVSSIQEPHFSQRKNVLYIFIIPLSFQTTMERII